ncbi:hypothetical protein DITRI_Ditri04bG0038200 [Diplodiscus trichospermus]
MTVTNFNYQMNYTQWTLVAQHPNLNNITQVFSFDYKPLIPYQSTMKAGLDGNVQSELILQKDMSSENLLQWR